MVFGFLECVRMCSKDLNKRLLCRKDMRQEYPLEEVRYFVERRYNLNIPVHPIRFESGLENTNYLITASTGEKYVFKIYEELKIPTITFELSFLQHCKNVGLPVQTMVYPVQ